MTKNEINNLSGAFALNAVSDTERAAYDGLLAESEEARNEFTELQDTAVMLGSAVDPVTPPPALRAALLAQIATTPQFSRLDAVTPSTVTAARRVVTPSIAPLAESTAASPMAATPATRKAQARWFQRPAVAIASVAAAIAIIAGGVTVGANFNQDTQPQVTASALEQLTLASDKQEIAVDVAGGGTATVIYSEKLGSSAIAMDGVGTPPAGQVLQLWYIDDSGPRSAGLMAADSGDFQILDGAMHTGDDIGVTVEPAGGSEQPTTSAVAIVKS